MCWQGITWHEIKRENEEGRRFYFTVIKTNPIANHDAVVRSHLCHEKVEAIPQLNPVWWVCQDAHDIWKYATTREPGQNRYTI